MERLFRRFLIVLVALAIGGGTASTAKAGKKLGNGKACKLNSDCKSKNCSFQKCKAKVGSTKKDLANGQKCKLDSDCKSKKCAFQKCVKKK